MKSIKTKINERNQCIKNYIQKRILNKINIHKLRTDSIKFDFEIRDKIDSLKSKLAKIDDSNFDLNKSIFDETKSLV